MSKFKNVGIEEANKMNELRLQLEIGKRAKYLREELGMERIECADLVSSLLNMGASLNKIFESKKSENNNK